MKKQILPVSFYFLFFVFCQSAFSNIKEINKIKENYVNLLIPSDKNFCNLNHLLASIEPENEISDQMVVELHQRYPFNLNKIEEYNNKLQEDGSWADINYEDQKRSGWEPKIHVERILELVKLYSSGQTPYHHSPEIENNIHKALDYWFKEKLVCPNWWYNQIGVPKTLGTAFILFEKNLTEKEKEEAIKIMEKSKFGMTGQNKVWLAGNVMMKALLQNNYSLVREARNIIVSEIVTNKKEGIQKDWSFHQHGAQQQFGNYGLAFISGMSFFSNIFSGTSLAFDEKYIDILNSFLREGYQWILWNGKMDINALGRQLFHNVPIHKGLGVAFAALELGGGQSADSNKIAQEIIENNFTSKTENSFTGHKHFQESDYTIHRRPHWMASLKMASNRVIGVETLNGDNMKGFYMADGAIYIYTDKTNYLNIFPFWDWRKIPGITAPDSKDVIPVANGNNSRNNSSFVGGISDGKEGMSSMILNRNGLKAYKSWIFTQDYIVCLGTGIEHVDKESLTTSIEQCYRKGELLYFSDERWNSLNKIHRVKAQEQRFFHNYTGYIVWNNPECIVTSEKRTGQWNDIMQMYTPKDEPEKEIFSLYIAHGDDLDSKEYQYVVLPETNKKQVEKFDLSSINILRNDTVAQIVFLKENDTYWLTAYQTINLEKDLKINLNIVTPGIYKIQKENAEYRIWYSDPTFQYQFPQID